MDQNAAPQLSRENNTFTHIRNDVNNFKFIYQIPLMEKKRLTSFLDQDSKWVELALRQMKYSADAVEDIRLCCSRTGQSPSERLLNNWANLDHTVTELFVILAKEKHYLGMDIIKKFVAPEFHFLLENKISSNSQKILNAPVAHPDYTAPYSSDRNAESALHQEEFVQQVILNKPVQQAAAVGRLVVENSSSAAGALPQFSYEELSRATNNWSEENVLGKGGFGIVYKGVFHFTDVAIKKIKGSNAASAASELRQTINELKYLNLCRHINVVQLLGCSIDTNELCLVSQYMEGGSLDGRLFPKQVNANRLTINDRVRIAMGTARGLQYLHNFIASKPVIHGDIKPGNILLDKENEPKIGDFGLTRELAVSNSSMKVSRAFGTLPYVPQEFLKYKQLSTKVDSYSYGLVLYEIVTGLRVMDDKRPIKHLRDVFKHEEQCNQPGNYMDKFLQREVIPMAWCSILLKVGFNCTKENPDERWEMEKVYTHFSGFFK